MFLCAVQEHYRYSWNPGKKPLNVYFTGENMFGVSTTVLYWRVLSWFIWRTAVTQIRQKKIKHLNLNTIKTQPLIALSIVLLAHHPAEKIHLKQLSAHSGRIPFFLSVEIKHIYFRSFTKTMGQNIHYISLGCFWTAYIFFNDSYRKCFSHSTSVIM